MPFPGTIYAPPAVYTQTNYDNPTIAVLTGIRIPVFIGTGEETLTQLNLENVRGSSSVTDQEVPQEDETGRAVVSVSAAGAITLGDFNGVITRFQVRNYPIVSGDGTGRVTNDTSTVRVTINGDPIVVLGVNGATGIVEIATAPAADDEVRATYFFNRTDTLTTDDVSDQVTINPALIQSEKSEPSGGFVVTADINTFIVTVDGVERTVDLGVGTKPISAIITLINSGLSGTSGVASQFTNNRGGQSIQIVADQSLEIGDGTANTLLGFTFGTTTSRRTVFTTFQGPIVDGTNGGITTTDPANVTVRVDNVQVIPTAVDGQNRQVTLPFAPASGSTVTIQYYFNTWQDTFDYLAHINVTEIIRTGLVPDGNEFTQGVDFVLKDDKIVWGTATLVNPGDTTPGATPFGESQITPTLVDTRTFLEEASAVTDTSVNPPVTSQTEFQLQRQPTTGNGRDTPLGQSLFQTVSNNRIDLPTNRPDLVLAYWGFGIQDALDRGAVEVIKVEGTIITLKEAVPPGATVYATHWYNTMQDNEYTLTSVVPGGSGVGTYTVTDSDGNVLYTPTFGTKGAALNTVTIEFPSGSELKPDVRFEGGTPREETITVTFASRDATLAKFTFPGNDPYYTITDASDHARLLIDNTALSGGAAGIDLARVNGIEGLGFPAQFLGEEVEYDVTTGLTTFDLQQGINDELSVTLDDVLITATAPANATATLDDYVDSLNNQAKLAANPPYYTAATRFIGSTIITALEYDKLTLHYTGAVTGLSGNWIATIAPATYATSADLATALQAAIAATNPVVGLTVGVTADGDGRLRLSIDALPPTDIGVAATDTITVALPSVAGDTVTFTKQDGTTATLTATNTPTIIGANNFDISSGVPATIALELDTAINDPNNNTFGIVTSTNLGPVNTIAAADPGTLGNGITITISEAVPGTFVVATPTLTGGTNAGGGFLEFIDDATPAEDFGILAGVSTDAATVGNQVKLLNCDIARRFTVVGVSGALLYDRVILRNRIVPGSGSVAGFFSLEQTELKIEGSSGSTQAGLVTNEIGLAGLRGTVQPATVVGDIGISVGQIPAGTYGDARDGQPAIEFFETGATSPQNNIFRFNIDGTPVALTFTDATGTAIPAGGSATVPLGPMSTANTVLAQIRTAAFVAGLSGAVVQQEGAGIRFTSAVTDTTSAVTIGDGNANSTLGFSVGDTAARTPVEARVLASALMAHHDASLATFYNSYNSPGATYFAGLALAGTYRDPANAEFLYLQSQAATGGGLGASSSITLLTPSAGNGSWLLDGTGLLASSGDGAVGEEAMSGFYVTSSDPEGSGSGNTSVFNSGVGQDGTVGQTYRDEVTGLTFTVLEREGGVSYPVGATSWFTFEVREIATTDANIPTNVIPGIELSVANTSGVATGDTAILDTIERGGAEPAVGDTYFTTYSYQKERFETLLFTRLSSVERAFGEIGPTNQLSLAARNAFVNSAVIVGTHQVLREPGSFQASIESYAGALEDLEGTLQGGTQIDYITPLRGDNLEFYQLLAVHADVQSSIRYRAERTVVAGLAAGTQPNQARDFALAIQKSRFRLVYPDLAYITVVDADANRRTDLVDGTFVAAALAGSLSSPNTDVATPWTGRTIFGFDRLGRTLDRVEANTVASSGVTILEDRPPNLRVRHGLTTNMETLLSRIPTVLTIADEVQQQTRNALERFIGIKFLPGVLSQIEGTFSTTLRLLVEAEIIRAYTGVTVQTSLTDPTIAEAEAFYQPVFPLLYVIVTFGLRSSL